MSVEECYLIVFRRAMTDPARVGERSVVEHEGLRVHVIWV
jgi:hypothetical protein